MTIRHFLFAAAAGAWWLGRGGKSSQPSPAQASIAVLPFVDLSPEKNQEYFSDGMAEEILNALARIKGLRVVDASVFPRIPGFFIVSAIYMIGEKAAETILAENGPLIP